MTNKVNIRSERIDHRHQRYTISSNMNGGRYLHQESPKKNNVRWTDRHGSPTSRSDTNKNKATSKKPNTTFTDQENFFQQPPTLHNSFDPLHGSKHHEDNFCKDPRTPLGKENNSFSIVHLNIDL